LRRVRQEIAAVGSAEGRGARSQIHAPVARAGHGWSASRLAAARVLGVRRRRAPGSACARHGERRQSEQR